MTTIWLGGPPETLFNPLSVVFVIGGAFVVIAACVSLSEMGEFSTTIGLISTLIGLVSDVRHPLNAPPTIGPSMAVAPLTTFFGAVLDNVVFLSLTSKLERNSQEKALINYLFVMGAAFIGNQKNSRCKKMLSNSILPPANPV